MKEVFSCHPRLMGSLIHLGLGNLELDWGKNSSFVNHSALFLPKDIREVPYFYAEGVIQHKRAYARPLRDIIRRLAMLGFSLGDCARLYESAFASVPYGYPEPVLTYEEFAEILKRLTVAAIGLPEEGDYNLGEYVAKAIMGDPEFRRLSVKLQDLNDDDGTFFENLNPYITLRLLAENPQNLDKLVIWRFTDIVESGYVEEASLYEGVPETDRCLVVTEGSSDGLILKEALPVVAPDLADFFTFVDMSENYPFTGTGNVYRFCQGLARIKIQNRILVVLDNDVAGREAYNRITSLELPSRMRVALLPELEECRRVLTLGPTGTVEEDVNGRAVSVECFLDIWNGEEQPTVRWTSFNEGLSAYQGELLHKENYVRRFLDTTRKDSKSYDYSRLDMLWNHLVEICAK